MIKFKIYVFFLIIFIGLGIVAYIGFNAWEDSQKNDFPIPSTQSSIGEKTAKEESALRGEKVSLEELVSKGDKVSLEEGLARIKQANTETKELADKFDVSALIEHLRKGELVELIKHLRGVQAKQAEPLQKEVQAGQAEKDNTGALQTVIERLKAEQEERLQKKRR